MLKQSQAEEKQQSEQKRQSRKENGLEEDAHNQKQCAISNAQSHKGNNSTANSTSTLILDIKR